jgi:hypothetical protein
MEVDPRLDRPRLGWKKRWGEGSARYAEKIGGEKKANDHMIQDFHHISTIFL